MCAKLSRSNSNAHIQWRTPSPNRKLMNGRFMQFLSFQHDAWIDSSPLSPMSCDSSNTLSPSSTSSSNVPYSPSSSSDSAANNNHYYNQSSPSPHFHLNRQHKSCNDIHLQPPMLIIPYHLESSSHDQKSSCNANPSKDHTSNDHLQQHHNNQKLPQKQQPHLQIDNNEGTSRPLLPTSQSIKTSTTTSLSIHNSNSSSNTSPSSLSKNNSNTSSPSATNNHHEQEQLKMPQNALPLSPQASKSVSAGDNGGYLGHSGKAYILVEKKSNVNTNEGMHMVKCSLRLKEGKSLLIKKQSEHTLTFKITPFTCAKYTPISSGSNQTMNCRFLVTVSELSSSSLGDKSNNTVVGNNSTISSQPTTSTKQSKQSYFVPELQFIFGSLEEAKEFSEKITNNVYCYCTDLVSNKIQKEVQHPKPLPTSDNKPEGYIIRKNQKAHIKTYQKPSIIYAELLNKQLLFYTSHKKTKVADVIGCRVDFTREKYYTDFLTTGTQKNEYHKMAFTLNVGNEGESRETLAFPTNVDTQKWLSIFSTSSSSPEMSSQADAYESGNEAEQEDEERGSSDEGDNEEEMDDELAQLLGLGGDTVVVHTEVATKEDVVGDAVLELGEPDIFGKRRNNVFNNGFWQPPKLTSTPSKSPESVSTPPVSPVKNSPLSEVQLLKNRVAELEKLLEEKTKECTELRKELNKK